MIKVMLADSDAENIKNFRTFIKSAFHDIKIVGSASPDVDFLKQVRELNPNLIIADVHFFGAAAISRIRDTFEFFPDKRFILYGTYNDAEYMEQVAEYGVIDRPPKMEARNMIMFLNPRPAPKPVTEQKIQGSETVKV